MKKSRILDKTEACKEEIVPLRIFANSHIVCEHKRERTETTRMGEIQDTIPNDDEHGEVEYRQHGLTVADSTPRADAVVHDCVPVFPRQNLSTRKKGRNSCCPPGYSEMGGIFKGHGRALLDIELLQ